jgi:hypothetical protein
MLTNYETHPARQWAVYNPCGVAVEALPFIYGAALNHYPHSGDVGAYAIAEDGTKLGSHLCSSDYYVPGDLGMIDGARPDRHETYRAHYPAGYRCEFVPMRSVERHEGLQRALAAAAARGR